MLTHSHIHAHPNTRIVRIYFANCPVLCNSPIFNCVLRIALFRRHSAPTSHIGTIPRNRIRSSTKDHQLIQIPEITLRFEIISNSLDSVAYTTRAPIQIQPTARRLSGIDCENINSTGLVAQFLRALAHWMIRFLSNPRRTLIFVVVIFLYPKVYHRRVSTQATVFGASENNRIFLRAQNIPPVIIVKSHKNMISLSRSEQAIRVAQFHISQMNRKKKNRTNEKKIWIHVAMGIPLQFVDFPKLIMMPGWCDNPPQTLRPPIAIARNSCSIAIYSRLCSGKRKNKIVMKAALIFPNQKIWNAKSDDAENRVEMS